VAAARVNEPVVWAVPRPQSVWLRAPTGLLRFARRKPLGFAGLVVVLVMIVLAIPAIAHAVAPYDYSKQLLRHRLEGPSSAHWLGTDSNGRDQLSRIIFGARVSIVVGFGAVAISQVIASLIGVVSGYYRGWFDRIFQRLVDLFQALPGLVVLITILGLWGSGLWQLVFALGIVGGPPASRIIRSQVLTLMNRPYVEAARAEGAGSLRIMLAHVLPNVVPLIILGATVQIGAVVLAEASLSFLGYGVPPPFPSWGQLLTLDGRDYMRQAPWLAICPGAAIALTVFSFNVFGDALRDVLDPRLRVAR
jgi:peptide/nickel transport system permease protein